MSLEIRAIENFNRQAKRLAKHYASIRDDYKTLLEELQMNPLVGTDLGGGIKKVRMPIASKGKGKSSGQALCQPARPTGRSSAEDSLRTLALPRH